MSLRQYIFDRNNDKSRKNVFAVPKSDDNTLLSRIYTSHEQRRVTKLRDGMLIEIPSATSLMIMKGGGLSEFCDGEGTYIYDSAAEEKPDIHDGCLMDTWDDRFAEFEDSLKDISFKGSDTRMYAVNTRLLDHIEFQINEPFAFKDAVYGILFARAYGKLSIKVTDPLVLASRAVHMKDCDGITLGEIMGEVSLCFQNALRKSVSRASCDNDISFDDVLEVQGNISEYMKDEINDVLSKRYGMELVSVQLISILPTAESKDAILQADRAKRRI